MGEGRWTRRIRVEEIGLRNCRTGRIRRRLRKSRTMKGQDWQNKQRVHPGRRFHSQFAVPLFRYPAAMIFGLVAQSSAGVPDA